MTLGSKTRKWVSPSQRSPFAVTGVTIQSNYYFNQRNVLTFVRIGPADRPNALLNSSDVGVLKRAPTGAGIRFHQPQRTQMPLAFGAAADRIPCPALGSSRWRDQNKSAGQLPTDKRVGCPPRGCGRSRGIAPHRNRYAAPFTASAITRVSGCVDR